VIDDAWAAADLAPFLHRGPNDRTTRLITTRDDAVLPKEAVRIRVDAMTEEQARTMLTRGLPVETSLVRDRLSELADRLGKWPLLLELANGELSDRVGDGERVEQAVEYVGKALERLGISGVFNLDNPEERRRTALGTLSMSLERLDPAHRERFAELAVFIEDALIPIDAAIGLWQQTAELSEFDGDKLLARLGSSKRLSIWSMTMRSASYSANV